MRKILTTILAGALALGITGCDSVPNLKPIHLGNDYVCSKVKFYNGGWEDAIFKDGALQAWTCDDHPNEYSVTLSSQGGLAMTYNEEGHITDMPGETIGAPQWVKDRVSNTDFDRTDQIYKLLRECEEYNKEK